MCQKEYTCTCTVQSVIPIIGCGLLIIMEQKVQTPKIFVFLYFNCGLSLRIAQTLWRITKNIMDSNYFGVFNKLVLTVIFLLIWDKKVHVRECKIRLFLYSVCFEAVNCLDIVMYMYQMFFRLNKVPRSKKYKKSCFVYLSLNNISNCTYKLPGQQFISNKITSSHSEGE